MKTSYLPRFFERDNQVWMKLKIMIKSQPFKENMMEKLTKRAIYIYYEDEA
jgi:hypothetical protein